MSTKKTFPGGIHPPQCKDITRDCEIKHGPSAKLLTIMLGQHIGAPCKPLVAKGDTVEAGQKIGDNDAFVCAPVHSPVNGKVKEITLAPHVVMGRSPAIVIEVDPENNPTKELENIKLKDFDESKYTAEEICQATRDAGLVGMGGAGFPTRVKLQPNPESPKKAMLINACECEPYITCDYRMMLERTEQIVVGIKLAKKASGCPEVFIGIEDNKPVAIKAFQDVLDAHPDETIKIVPLQTKYPQGGERQLIRSVLGKDVPTGSIPPMIGVLVLNVATTAAIANAVINKTPLTHRVVTITGQAIANPGNFYVPIGTPANELIEFCGSVTEKSAKVVFGGPMMGIAIADLTTPITKASGAITILTKDQIGKAKYAKQQTPCIRCGRCLDICPEKLNPTRIAHAVKHELFDVAQSYFMSACIECGCCSYVCPANIELTGQIKTGKIFVARKNRKMPK